MYYRIQFKIITDKFNFLYIYTSIVFLGNKNRYFDIGKSKLATGKSAHKNQCYLSIAHITGQS